MFLKNVFIGFLSLSILHADTLKERKNEADRISGCVEREYYSNGNLRFEIPYNNNKQEGIEKWYHENGNLVIETPYTNGEIEGMAKQYFANGNLWVETPYNNNKQEGIEKWYHENGNLMAEMSYLDDLLHGDMKYYTEDKKLLALVKAENNEFISGKCFDDKVLTDKDLKEIRIISYYTEGVISHLQEICLKESDPK